jgi:hypothetical protein
MANALGITGGFICLVFAYMANLLSSGDPIATSIFVLLSLPFFYAGIRYDIDESAYTKSFPVEAPSYPHSVYSSTGFSQPDRAIVAELDAIKLKQETE